MGSAFSNDCRKTPILAFIARVMKRHAARRPPAPPLDLTAQPSCLDEDEPLQKLIEKARKELGLNSVDYNYAVVGASGVGKSSFVNAIRLLQDTRPDAAPVQGGETERTIIAQRYSHPLLKYVFFWDFPSAGSIGHPAATYFSEMKLYAFDCILIVSSDRFLAVDFSIAKSAVKYNKRCAFIRTKADLAVKSISDRKGVTALEASQELREAVRGSFRQGLKFSGLSAKADKIPLFIISNRAFTTSKAYNLRKEGMDKLDTTLEKMDEEKIYEFVTQAVKLRRVFTTARGTPSTSKPKVSKRD